MQTTLPFIESNSHENCFSAVLYSMQEKKITAEYSVRMKKSWRISRRGNLYQITLPTLFKESPVETKKEMIEWAQILISSKLSRTKLTPEQRKRISFLEKNLWTFLNGGNSETLSLRTYKAPHERFRHSFGAKFDLKVQFSKLNTDYFDGKIKSFLRWGQHGSKTSYHTVISDELMNKHDLITIAGLYNHPSIPE